MANKNITISISIPFEVFAILSAYASKENKNFSHVVSEALCRGLAIDGRELLKSKRKRSGSKNIGVLGTVMNNVKKFDHMWWPENIGEIAANKALPRSWYINMTTLYKKWRRSTDPINYPVNKDDTNHAHYVPMTPEELATLRNWMEIYGVKSYED